MRMYPAYRFKDVMDERAVTFFSLVKEGKLLLANEKLLQANLAQIPILTSKAREKLFDELLETAGYADTIEVIDTSTQAGKNKLKNIL